MLPTKPEYEKYINSVKYVQSVYNGSEEAKQHLQQFTKENPKKFDNRKEVATLNNFVKRTVNAMRNIIFRNPTDASLLPPSFDEFKKAVDFTDSLNEFAKDITDALVRDGETWILVDSLQGEATSRAEERELGLRPYFVHINRASVVNWRYDNQGRFEFVVIRENYVDIDGFKEETKEQDKVWYADGRVQTYRDDELYKEYQLQINQVPIVRLIDSKTPSLLDQAKLNVSHMNRNSELDQYIRVASAPVPVTYKMTSDDGGITTIGVNDGIAFSSGKDEAGFEWVSLKAENTEAISNRIKDYEEAMLDIAITFASSSQVKTATQVETESTEDKGKLSNIAQIVEDGLNQALRLIEMFNESYKLTDEQIVIINRDFDSARLAPEQIAQLKDLYINEVISWETFITLLEKGEVLTIEDKEKEKASLNR
jgi:hypothetical protein